MPPEDTVVVCHRVPPLENGDRLTRSEFERRYEAMPVTVLAELIEQVVFIHTPEMIEGHDVARTRVSEWLGIYTASYGNASGSDRGIVRLDPDNEMRPDAFIAIDYWSEGQSLMDHIGNVDGAPELVIEISSSTVSIDLHTKKNVYRRNGVKEYVVWRVQDEEIDWFVLRDEAYVQMAADAEGLYRSEALPGLVLDMEAMLAGDLKQVVEVQQKALTIVS